MTEVKAYSVIQLITKDLTLKPFVRKYSSISKYVPKNPCHLKSQLKASIAIFIYNVLNQEGALTGNKKHRLKENGGKWHCLQTFSKLWKAGENLLLGFC